MHVIKEGVLATAWILVNQNPRWLLHDDKMIVFVKNS
jgi:hypothetical protein